MVPYPCPLELNGVLSKTYISLIPNSWNCCWFDGEKKVDTRKDEVLVSPDGEVQVATAEQEN